MNEKTYMTRVYQKIQGQRTAKRRDLKILERQEKEKLDPEKVIYNGAFITEEGKRNIEDFLRNWAIEDRKPFSKQKNMHMMIEFYGGNPDADRSTLLSNKDIGKLVYLPVIGVGFYEEDGIKMNIGLEVAKEKLNSIILYDDQVLLDFVRDRITHIPYALNTQEKDENGKIKAKAINAIMCNYHSFEMAQLQNIQTMFFVEARLGCAYEHNSVSFNINKDSENNEALSLSIEDILNIHYDQNGDNYYLNYHDANFINKKFQQKLEHNEMENTRKDFEHFIRLNLRDLKMGSAQRRRKKKKIELKLLRMRDKINDLEKRIVKFDIDEINDLLDFYLDHNIIFSDLMKFNDLIERRKNLIVELGNYFDETENPILSNDELLESIYLYQTSDESNSKRGKFTAEEDWKREEIEDELYECIEVK